MVENKMTQLPSMKQIPDVLKMIERTLNTITVEEKVEVDKVQQGMAEKRREETCKHIDHSLHLLHSVNLTLVLQTTSVMRTPTISSDDIRSLGALLTDIDLHKLEASDIFIQQNNIPATRNSLLNLVPKLRHLYSLL